VKSFESLLNAHPSSTILSYSKRNPDGSQGPWRPLDLEFYYSNAKGCSLPEEAPEDIRQMWETAQHLLVYSYFEYSFVSAAELHCAVVVEAVLRNECADQIVEYSRKRIEKGKSERDPGFSELLGFFKKKTREVLTNQEAQFLYERLDALRELRNSFAHAERRTLYPPGQSLMIRTSEWLGAYYRKELKSFVQKWMKYSDERNRELREVVERARRESTT